MSKIPPEQLENIEEADKFFKEFNREKPYTPPQTMTTLEILRNFKGEICAACNHKKRARQSFCPACYKELPGDMKRALWKPFFNGYEEAFLDVLEYLSRSWNKKPKAQINPGLFDDQ